MVMGNCESSENTWGVIEQYTEVVAKAEDRGSSVKPNFLIFPKVKPLFTAGLYTNRSEDGEKKTNGEKRGFSDCRLSSSSGSDIRLDA